MLAIERGSVVCKVNVRPTVLLLPPNHTLFLNFSCLPAVLGPKGRDQAWHLDFPMALDSSGCSETFGG